MVCSLEDRQLGREANQRISEPHSAILYKSVAECNDRDEFPVGDLNARLAPAARRTIIGASAPDYSGVRASSRIDGAQMREFG
jgi:hypothetical protein